MDDLLTQITGLTGKERKRLLSWVISLPEPQIVDVFQFGVKTAYQIKENRADIPGKICKYSAFIVAARKRGWDTENGKGYRVAETEQYENFDHLRKSRAAELIRKGRTPIKRKKILAHWGEIKQLRHEGLGFRTIAMYLSKNRKLEVSASYLAELYKKVEVEHGFSISQY